MLTYIARRFLTMIITMVFVSVMGFIIINLPPGSYHDYYIEQLDEHGTTTADSQIESLKRRYGLDQPPTMQYLMWAKGFFTGGPSEAIEECRKCSSHEKMLVTSVYKGKMQM